MHPITVTLAALLAIVCPAAAQELRISAEPGAALRLAEDDFQLKLEASHEWAFSAPAGVGERQVVLGFRARIDNPATIGSSNGVFIEVNGKHVGLSTPRRQVRLLNKPNRFEWTVPPFLTWYLPAGDWRLAYAPDFEILLERKYYGPEAYEFELDITDLLAAGENNLNFRHAANQAIAAHAGSDMTLFFRDLRLEVREGPGVLPGQSAKPDHTVPFEPRESRSAPLSVMACSDGQMMIEVRGHEYQVASRFSAPGEDGRIAWYNFRGIIPRGPTAGSWAFGARTPMAVEGPGWRIERRYEPGWEGKPLVHGQQYPLVYEGKPVGIDDPAYAGRQLVHDTLTNTSDHPVGIRIEHTVRGAKGCERVSFGGREDPDITELNRPSAPYLFLPREDHGLALVACDDVLREHGVFFFDDETQTAGIRDDWFGLRPGESYTMTWAIYATDTPNVFDLVNLLRDDWLEPFTIEGGINFFEPDAILAYDDDELRAHLELLNINIMMSQGGWVDRKLLIAGTKNLGHGPIVTSDVYADYRRRLKAAIEKLRRVRPGVKCLVYLDTWLVTGDDLVKQWGASIWTRKDGQPLQNSFSEAWNTHIALVVPTLENSVGRELLEKIPTLYLDEIGADGMYWDEMSRVFGGSGWVSGRADYAHPDGHTFEIDRATGEVVAECGAAELASLPFKQALLHAFLDRGATVIANTTPTTLTETREQFTRFNETSIPHHPGTIYKAWTYTPVSYAGYSVYHAPGVGEQEFLADIRDKLWDANLYLFSSHIFYHLFTHENLATYQYPITPVELDWGLVIGRERIITLRSGRFRWPQGRTGELLIFDEQQRIAERKPVRAGPEGFIEVRLGEGQAAVIVKD